MDDDVNYCVLVKSVDVVTVQHCVACVERGRWTEQAAAGDELMTGGAAGVAS